jgi:hypothetical protein
MTLFYIRSIVRYALCIIVLEHHGREKLIKGFPLHVYYLRFSANFSSPSTKMNAATINMIARVSWAG